MLIFAPYFPPYNAIGSVRSGNFARFLISNAVDVRVISAAHPELDQSQEQPLNEDHVSFVSWYDSNPHYQLQHKANINLDKYIKLFPRLRRFLMIVLRALLYWPDRHQLWVKPSCREADELIESWKPDLIFASALPASALFVARKMADKHAIPWIAEFRDLWAYNEFNETWLLKNLIYYFWEKRVLASASTIVTVSEGLASVLRKRHGNKVQVVLNGYSSRNISNSRQNTPPPIVMRHMGSLYGDKRDPSSLLRALSALGADKNLFRVEFFGDESEQINKSAARYGVSDVVVCQNKVSYAESLELQATADVLLLIMWNNSRERDIYTGKFFEYVATDNPILLLGNPDTELARNISKNRLGVSALTEEEVLIVLRDLIAKVRDRRSLRRASGEQDNLYAANRQFRPLLATIKAVVENNK